MNYTSNCVIKFINFQSWALSVFFYFLNNKKWYFCIFYEDNNLFLHQSYLKSPLPAKYTLIKNAKYHFLLLKNTESAQLWKIGRKTSKKW